MSRTPSGGRTVLRRSALALLVAALALACLPARATAHAELVEAAPIPNASLPDAPDEVTITFSEPIDPGAAFIDLIDSRQRRVEGVGTVEVSDDGRRAAATLPPLEDGTYIVTYQVVSTVDGHATTGQFAFLVDPSGAAAPPTTPTTSTSPSVDALTVAARWAALVGFLVALGALLHWAQAGRHVLAPLPSAARRPPWLLVATGFAVGAAGVAAYLWLSARPIAAALGPSAGGLPFDPAGAFGWTPFAVAMRIAIVAGLVGAVVAVVRRRSAERTTLIGAALLGAVGLAGMSAAGHAASYGGPVAAAVDLLHLLGVTAWLGALPAAVVLAARSGTPRATGGALLRRHGRVALVAAPLVALTGIANSPLVLGAARDVVASDYGNLLLAKVGLLAAGVGIGAVNHLSLRGRGRAAVGLLVGAELVVAAVAVSAAATMVTIQPASARPTVLAAPPVNPAHLFGEIGPSRVHATVNLPTPSNQVIQVSILDAETGIPRSDVQKAFVELTPPPAAELQPERVELAPDDEIPGLFSISGAYTPVDGAWELEVIVRRSGELDESLRFELPVSTPAPAEPAPPQNSGVTVPPPMALVWQALPGGALAWLPVVGGLAALVVLWLVGRGRAGAWPFARALLALVVLVAGLGAVTRTVVEAANAPELAPVATPPASLPPASDRGEGLYLANCAGCHGVDGDGEGPIPSLPRPGPLADSVPEMSAADLSYRIAYGVAGTPMPAFAGRLTQAERWELVAYLRSRWDEP